jgi:hypothetical protein
MFIDVTSEDKYKEKNNNKCETELISTKSVVQLTMTTKGTFTRQSDCQQMCRTGQTVDFTTHTSTICTRYQVLLAAYHKTANTYLLFPPDFIFLFYTLITFRFTLFLFLFFHSVYPPPILTP